MSLWSLIVGLVLVAALVAYVGDVVGRRVGRRHWRLFGLRPRTTALLIAVFTGILIALMAIAAFFLLDTDARKTILEAEQVREERNQLRGEVERLGGHVQELEARAARALGKTEQLERELSAKAEALKLAEAEIYQLQEEKKQLQQDIEDTRKALQEREMELSRVRAEVERIQAERDSLEEEFDVLQENQVNLLNELGDLKQTELRALARAEEAQQKAKEATEAMEKAQARVQAIQREIDSLEREKQQLLTEKQQLLGDIATLDAERKALEDQKQSLQATNRNLQDELAAAKLEIFNLKQDLLKLGRERNAMEQGLEVLSRQLSQSLKDTVLAEVAWREGPPEAALERTVHQAEMQARAEGFRGALVPEGLPTKEWRAPGVIQARAEGVSLDGKVLLQIRYVPRERRFVIGQVIAMRELPPPRYQPERTRRALEDLREAAYERLLKAGVLPEKVARSGLSGIALADFQALINDETSNVVAAVVAADDIWTTETPQLIYQILYVP